MCALRKALTTCAMAFMFVAASTQIIASLPPPKGPTSSSPESYGALGNGTGNDTAACQKAVDAGASRVNFKGTYRITAPIQLPSNIEVHFEPGSKFIVDIPSTVSWEDNATGRMAGASAFVNRKGLQEYIHRAVAKRLVDHFKRLPALDHNIRFTGKGDFMTSTLDEKKQTGAWGAISFLYVDGCSVESLHTNTLQGVYFCETTNGNMGDLRGDGVRNWAIAGGVVLVGLLSENLKFDSVTGWRCDSTFVIDAVAANNIDVGTLDAGDVTDPKSPEWPPRSLRHVELGSCHNVTIHHLNIHGGGNYQCLMLNIKATNCKIYGTISDPVKEAITIAGASNNVVQVTVRNPWKSRARGFRLGATGLLTKDSGEEYRPVVIVMNSNPNFPAIQNNQLDITVEKDSDKSNSNIDVLETGMDESARGKISGNVYRINAAGREPLLRRFQPGEAPVR